MEKYFLRTYLPIYSYLSDCWLIEFYYVHLSMILEVVYLIRVYITMSIRNINLR